MSASVCIATYRCYDDKADFNKKAQGIAVGLTVGSWTDLPKRVKRRWRSTSVASSPYMCMSPSMRYLVNGMLT